MKTLARVISVVGLLLCSVSLIAQQDQTQVLDTFFSDVITAASNAKFSLRPAVTDRLVRPKPPMPIMGLAGFSFRDLTFGSKIIRVTDANTRTDTPGLSFRTPAASPQRAINSTSDRFYATSTDGSYWSFRWDGTTVTRDPDQIPLSGDVSFSRINPTLLYGRSRTLGLVRDRRAISSYDLATKRETLVLDPDVLIPTLAAEGDTYSANVFSTDTSVVMSFGGTGNDFTHYVVSLPLSGGAPKILNTLTRPEFTSIRAGGFRIHSSPPDLSGRFILIQPSVFENWPTGGPTFNGIGAILYIWDTQTDKINGINWSTVSGHWDLGYGRAVNQNATTLWDPLQWLMRDLSAPNANVRELVSPVRPVETYIADHTNWNNAKPNVATPIYSATYRYYTQTAAVAPNINTTPWRPWDDEILAIATDGSGTVTRLAHHRSDVSPVGPGAFEFWYTPRPSVAPNGRWIIFTSNWDKTLGVDSRDGLFRQDVFLLQLP